MAAMNEVTAATEVSTAPEQRLSTLLYVQCIERAAYHQKLLRLRA